MIHINPTPEDLTKIQPGVYNLTDAEYFGEALSSVAHSQSDIKKIKKKSIKRIKKEREENKDTVARRIGKAIHYRLEGEEEFSKNVFVKREIAKTEGKMQFIDRRIVELKIPQVEKITDFLSEKLKGCEKPGKAPLKKDFAGEENQAEAWEKAKVKYDREKDAYEKKESAARKEHQDILKRANDIKVKVQAEWAEIDKEYQERKSQYEYELEYAEKNRKTIISEKELETVEMAYQESLRNPDMQRLILNSLQEMTLIVRHPSGILVKMKLDLISLSEMWYGDWKTADDIDNDDFYWSFKGEKYRLDIQAAVYRWGIEQVFGIKMEKFYALVLSKVCDENVVYEIESEWIDEAWIEADRRIHKYAHELEMFERGESRYDGIVKLKNPYEDNLDEVFDSIDEEVA